MGEFSLCFAGAARVVVTETFAARSGVASEAEAAGALAQRRPQQDGAGAGEGGGEEAAAPASLAASLASAIGAQGAPVAFVPSLEDVAERLAWELRNRSALDVEGTVTIVTVGAGDVTTVGCVHPSSGDFAARFARDASPAASACSRRVRGAADARALIVPAAQPDAPEEARECSPGGLVTPMSVCIALAGRDPWGWAGELDAPSRVCAVPTEARHRLRTRGGGRRRHCTVLLRRLWKNETAVTAE